MYCEQELWSNKLKDKSPETEIPLSNVDEDDPSFPRFKSEEGVIQDQSSKQLGMAGGSPHTETTEATQKSQVKCVLVSFL